jgi:hypothetical protein
MSWSSVGVSQLNIERPAMRRFSRFYIGKLCVGLGALALVAAFTDQASAQPGFAGPPPAPKIYVRPPPIQQPSFWGINQNLQSERDHWQWQQHHRRVKITGSTKYLER